MRVIAYMRLAALEKEPGLDRQQWAIDEWAKSRGQEIVDWFVDTGLDGESGFVNRVALPEAMAVLGAGDGLILHSVDRLDPDPLGQEVVLAEVRRRGGRVFSTSPHEQGGELWDHPSDANRASVRKVVRVVSDYQWHLNKHEIDRERRLNRKRALDSRRRKAEKGGYAYGAPPYGWHAVGGELVEAEDEQRVIARIKALREDGVGVGAIAKDLNDVGLTARRGRWHATTVARVLGRSYSRRSPALSETQHSID